MENPTETQEPFLGGKSSAGKCFQEDTQNFRSTEDNARRSLCLTETVLEHTDARGTPSLLHLSNVVGARASSPGAGTVGGGHLLEVFAYVPGDPSAGCSKGICGKQRRPAHLKWLASDSNTAETWATAINDILKATAKTPQSKQHADPPPAASAAGGEGKYGSCVERIGSTGNVATGPGRRLLVLVNPVSGTGSSLKIWEKTLRPMLEQALSDVTPVISTHAGELAEVVRYAGNRSDHTASSAARSGRSKAGVGDGGGAESVVDVGSLDDFDGIVVLGGDGTLFEVLQGMYARPDYERQLSRLALGVVPTGTGNGLAKTISEESGEEFGATSASFLVAKGSTSKMDLLHTEVGGSKKYLAFLNVGWGMVSDVDIESEAYRWLGSFRFTLGTVIRIVGLRHYSGRISFLPARPDAAAVSSISYAGNPQSSSNSCSAPGDPFRMPPLSEAIAGTSDEATALESEFITVEGEFVLADIARAKYISHDMPMAPASRLDDGLMDLFFVRKGAGRIGMTKMFLAMEKGEHVSLAHPSLEWHRVRAFRIEPLSSRGRLTVDGELVDYAPLQQHVWPKAANIMCCSTISSSRVGSSTGGVVA